MTIQRISTAFRTNRRCAFAVWHGQRKFTFKSQVEYAANGGEKHNIASVGLPGDIVVFMARSRVERDMWVSALGQEINRHASTVGEPIDIYQPHSRFALRYEELGLLIWNFMAFLNSVYIYCIVKAVQR